MSFPRPLRKQFKAGRILPCVPKWLALKPNVLHYYAALNIAIEDDLDYRYMELNPGDEVLLVGPKGLSTQDIKVELFTHGWDHLLENHPYFRVFTRIELGLQLIHHHEDLATPTLVFARSIKTGELRKSGIVYPRVAVMGQRDE
jgi:hypothetical protein